MSGTPRLPPSALSDALVDGRYDIALFARGVLGIELHPGQVAFGQAVLMRDRTGIRPEYLTHCLSSGNRAGKTLILDVLAAHGSLYKYGQPPPDPSSSRSLMAHAARRFAWYHFGISIDVAELVAEELRAIIAGTHIAQTDGCPLTDYMGKAVATVSGARGATDFRWHDMLGGGSIHFRTTGERAVSQLGRDMHAISYDECGFDPHLNFIVNEVLHLRRLSTGGQMIMVSTPSEGFNQWYDQWLKGDPEDPMRDPDVLSMRMSTRDNVGYGLDRPTFDRMVASMPPHLVPQNIDGHFIEGDSSFFDAKAVDGCFVEGMAHRAEPEARGRYVQGVDPALVYDATWSIVLKLGDSHTPTTGVLAARLQGKQTVTKVTSLVRDTHAHYSEGSSRCDTGLDTTGMGGKVMRDMLSDITGIRQVDFGGKGNRKLILLTDLKGLIESGRFRFPRSGIWLELRHQLLGYRLKDRGLATDAVMALAVAARVMTRYQQVTAAPGSPFTFFDQSEGSPLAKRGKPMSHADFLGEHRGNVTMSDSSGRIVRSTMEGWHHDVGSREWLLDD